MHDDSTQSAASRSDAHWDVHARLEDPMGVLAIALGQWEDGRPRPFARRAASTAMDAIDAMLADLHAMRARLVTEIRASDDATAARADALLAGIRAGSAT
jgi:hypothetical protein